VASIGPERKAHQSLGSEPSERTRGMDIAHTILATLLDRHQADKAPPVNATFGVLLGAVARTRAIPGKKVKGRKCKGIREAI
jgi:hypothetical protein